MSDQYGDLERITLEVYDDSKPNKSIDSKTIDASGSVDSGDRTFEVKHGEGSQYRIVFEVTNGSHVRTREREVRG
ncbi:hypothetical protein [Natrinema salsiterrestre]|uniref:Uncharacterized protein n=1 Tax=Natrinema salsiterrestre TaxID=2950540 RepID=A0A9Q4Q2Q9_9EURY|nr:hypothetical protein [Natrinema salsiterrestre]MDF9746761.1 hypothetical protein [Natrinema salsiterrestre]